MIEERLIISEDVFSLAKFNPQSKKEQDSKNPMKLKSLIQVLNQEEGYIDPTEFVAGLMTQMVSDKKDSNGRLIPNEPILSKINAICQFSGYSQQTICHHNGIIQYFWYKPLILLQDRQIKDMLINPDVAEEVCFRCLNPRCNDQFIFITYPNVLIFTTNVVNWDKNMGQRFVDDALNEYKYYQLSKIQFEEGIVYHLYGYVCHEGHDGYLEGKDDVAGDHHYVSYVRNIYGSKNINTANWYRYDGLELNVLPKKINLIESIKRPYLLFYTKVRNNLNIIETTTKSTNVKKVKKNRSNEVVTNDDTTPNTTPTPTPTPTPPKKKREYYRT